MHFVVIGKDRGDLRRARRAAHLEYVEGRQQSILYAGPLIEQGRMIGSIFIFALPDRAALDAYLAEDPYFAGGGIFGAVEIYESRRMVPEVAPGFLRAEADRARTQE